MDLPLAALIRLPRVLLEHPLPQEGPGLSPLISFHSTSGEPCTLQLGGVDRWNRTPPVPCTGLTLERFTLLAALLSVHQRSPLAAASLSSTPSAPTPITFNQLFRALTGSTTCCSAHHRATLKNLLAELEATDCALTTPTGTTYHKLLTITPSSTRPIFGRAAPAFHVHFAPTFLDALCDQRAATPFRLDVFLSLRSRLARSLYIFLPTWAAYAKAHPSRPFRITLARLMEHLGTPPLRHLSQRRAYFAGHRKDSILTSLHGLPTAYGTLALTLAPATSVADDCIGLWVDAQMTEEKYLKEDIVESSAFDRGITKEEDIGGAAPIPATISSRVTAIKAVAGNFHREGDARGRQRGPSLVTRDTQSAEYDFKQDKKDNFEASLLEGPRPSNPSKGVHPLATQDTQGANYYSPQNSNIPEPTLVGAGTLVSSFTSTTGEQPLKAAHPKGSGDYCPQAESSRGGSLSLPSLPSSLAPTPFPTRYAQARPNASDPMASFRHLKVYAAWVASARTDTEFLTRVKAPTRLTPHDLEILQGARIVPARCERFLTLAKKLLSNRTWLDLIGEARYAAQSNTPPLSPEAKLIAELMSAIRAKL